MLNHPKYHHWTKDRSLFSSKRLSKDVKPSKQGRTKAEAEKLLRDSLRAL